MTIIAQNDDLTLRRFRVGSLATNCYFLSDQSGKTIIIDPGDEGDFLSEQLLQEQLQPILIFLTHAHFDHVGGVSELYLNFHLPIYLDKRDWPLYERASDTARHFGEKATLPTLPLDLLALSPASLATLLAGFDPEAQLLAFPGHTPGLSAIYLPRSNWLLSGDFIFAGGVTGRTDLPDSDPPAMRDSLSSVHRLPPTTLVFPGHEDFFELTTFFTPPVI